MRIKAHAARVRRRNHIRAFALELLYVAGYVPRSSFRKAMQIARDVTARDSRKGAE